MEATLLIALQLKLDDLEAQIRAHRGDLLLDFHRHCCHLLKDVDPDVASSVKRAIVPAFSNYPFLRPELDTSPPDPLLQPDITTPSHAQDHTHAHLHQPMRVPEPVPVPVPVTRIESAAGNVSDKQQQQQYRQQRQRQPHGETAREREDDLRGLFTPSYLPLLECASSRSQSSANARISIEDLQLPPASATEVRVATAATSSSSSSSSPPLPPRTSVPIAATATAAKIEAETETETKTTTIAASTSTTTSITTTPEAKEAAIADMGQNELKEDPETVVVVMEDQARLTEQSRSATPPRPQAAVDIDVPAPLAGTRAPDDSPSSVCSDKSDSKIRKSALRRSSSLSKTPQSPRRVRFDVKGAEVLPTASPQANAMSSTGVTLSYMGEDESLSLNKILDRDSTIPTAPPKISSSEALRALSRRPLEEGTIWTVVNPVIEDDETEAEQHQQQQQQQQRDQDQDQEQHQQHHQQQQQQQQTLLTDPMSTYDSAEALPVSKHSSGSASYIEEGGTYRGLPLEELGALNDANDSGDSDDDNDYLTMYSLRSSKNPPNPGPMQSQQQDPSEESPMVATPAIAQQQAPSETTDPRAKDRDNQAADDDDDDDDDAAAADDDGEFFMFEPGVEDDSSGISPKKPQPPPLDSDSDDELDAPTTSHKEEEPGASSISPQGSSMTRPALGNPDGSPVTRFGPASIGSYKGRPVMMPVVKDPDVYALAASLGDINTFVGGLDGRSGIDAGDLNSFRHSMIASTFGGEPRSFTERLLMEEAEKDLKKDMARFHKMEGALTKGKKEKVRKEKIKRESQGKKAKETRDSKETSPASKTLEASQPETVGEGGGPGPE